MGTFRFRQTGRVDDLSADSSEQKFGGDVDFSSTEPNVVTSLWDDMFRLARDDDPWHMPVIDIDFPIHVEPSSTSGHFHLYIDRTMSAKDLFKLLEVMVEVGIVEQGYLDASRQRGYTTARLPWIKKSEPEAPTPTPAGQGREPLGFTVDGVERPY